jgi:NAD(P)-dependent dehydrogenase (short-subunit alcohol dehydrogenase family)
VVATARTIKPSEDPDTLTVDGDLADPATADRIVGAALERFGRIDTLVNNAGVFISKPFTDYTAADYATVVTDQRQAVDAVERTVAELGRLDTVVNNAGVTLLGPSLDASTDEWDRMVALNVQGLLHVTQPALPHLLHAAEDSPRHVSTPGRPARWPPCSTHRARRRPGQTAVEASRSSETTLPLPGRLASSSRTSMRTMRCADPGQVEAATSVLDQTARASSSNATAIRRPTGSSTASS